MSKRYIISDLHLGHNNILNFEPMRLGEPLIDIAEHDAVLGVRWNTTINPKDIVYILGDVAFKAKALEEFSEWNGIKILVRGNHDDKAEDLYRKVFSKVYGVLKVNKVWLSHAPIHPNELRGCPNIHGHVHRRVIRKPTGEIDTRYRSVCVEANQGWPEDMDKVIKEVSN